MIFTRQQLEELQDQNLAPYAIRSKDSKGRSHPEDEPDYRTVFQRDRDRILHTTAFRRLEYKTQVFINYEGDYYRTRLTHTLEVAQIGRSIARALGANEDLVESICLAHDLGHPPFGHSGERELARLMVDHGGFNHNKHSFRIVTELEKRYPEFDGLNLTWEVLEGMIKHETEYDVSDAADFDPSLRGHLEAQIANAADELAYTAHDLDDGLRSGLITPDDLSGISLWEVINESIGRRRTETGRAQAGRNPSGRQTIRVAPDSLLRRSARHKHGCGGPLRSVRHRLLPPSPQAYGRAGGDSHRLDPGDPLCPSLSVQNKSDSSIAGASQGNGKSERRRPGSVDQTSVQ